ncbi:MAG TPA: copper-binding protein [Thermoanaerobaculia bacterium]|nr:copper-binding protein [Thermoanaerobaculia bacterium]
MNIRLLLFAFLLTAACGVRERIEPATATSTASEKLYVVTGKILGRDAKASQITVDHDKIEGFMEAMTMNYVVRGADVATLPADGSKFTAKLHVTDDGYWVTDVKAVP